MPGLFELIYYLGYSVKKYYSLKNQKKLPHKVISIGNITTGGTGKTPAVIAVAEEAKRRGFNPVILTRGYKGKAEPPCFVELLADSYQLTAKYGDEPVLMTEKLKDVLIVKCKDRYKGGMFALKQLKAVSLKLSAKMLFILDDGFQHWRLFRDKDVLLIDSENPFTNKRLLPMGLLREPLKEIRRADIIVLTKTSNSQSEASNLIEEIKKYNSMASIFFAEHKPSGFTKPSGETRPVEWAAGKNLFAFCGIGNPESFRKTVISTGANLRCMKTYRDHYRYAQGDIENIVIEAHKNNADLIVTTEKDMVRLRGLNIPKNLIALAIEFRAGKELYDEVFS
ncbi:MAG: tetraacyldisaccharide 4'-kinase [Nitrospirae bacterium]|nr:tetraacyldisaccharide 4'-kinase [Nitrospirota bacterium]